MAHKRSFINPTLREIHDAYPYVAQPPTVTTRCFLRIVRELLAIGALHVLDLDDARQREIFVISKGRGLLPVKGWLFRDFDAIRTNQTVLQAKYRPAPATIHEADTFLKRFTRRARILGVHIRRGDYRVYEDGMYYFTDQEYKAWILQCLGTIKNDAVILFSNEPVDLDFFQRGVAVPVAFSGHSWPVDHVLMSRCSYLMGPTSTFTMWASFLGRVPFLELQRGLPLNPSRLEYYP